MSRGLFGLTRLSGEHGGSALSETVHVIRANCSAAASAWGESPGTNPEICKTLY